MSPVDKSSRAARGRRAQRKAASPTSDAEPPTDMMSGADSIGREHLPGTASNGDCDGPSAVGSENRSTSADCSDTDQADSADADDAADDADEVRRSRVRYLSLALGMYGMSGAIVGYCAWVAKEFSWLNAAGLEVSTSAGILGVVATVAIALHVAVYELDRDLDGDERFTPTNLARFYYSDLGAVTSGLLAACLGLSALIPHDGAVSANGILLAAASAVVVLVAAAASTVVPRDVYTRTRTHDLTFKQRWLRDAAAYWDGPTLPASGEAADPRRQGPPREGPYPKKAQRALWWAMFALLPLPALYASVKLFDATVAGAVGLQVWWCVTTACGYLAAKTYLLREAVFSILATVGALLTLVVFVASAFLLAGPHSHLAGGLVLVGTLLAAVLFLGPKRRRPSDVSDSPVSLRRIASAWLATTRADIAYSWLADAYWRTRRELDTLDKETAQPPGQRRGWWTSRWTRLWTAHAQMTGRTHRAPIRRDPQPHEDASAAAPRPVSDTTDRQGHQ